MSKKPNNHFFSFENQNNLHNYWFARKFPPCMFIDFHENFPPARLFRPTCLFGTLEYVCFQLLYEKL